MQTVLYFMYFMFLFHSKVCLFDLVQLKDDLKYYCQAWVQVTPGQLKKTPSQNSRDLDLELEAIIAMSHNRLRQVYNRLRHPPRKLF